MARLATTAAHFCQRIQELYPPKSNHTNRQSDQPSPFRRWTTGSGASASYRTEPRGSYGKKMSGDIPPIKKAEEPAEGISWQPGTRVAKWSLGLESLLADPVGVAAYTHFLDAEFASENIRFFIACENYARLGNDVEARRIAAEEIWNLHLADGAPELVNIDASARRSTALNMKLNPPPADLFSQARDQVYHLLRIDSYLRFLRSPIHKECATADDNGQPLPLFGKYTTNKVKKSSSNASDVRRNNTITSWQKTGSRAPANSPQPGPSGSCGSCRPSRNSPAPSPARKNLLKHFALSSLDKSNSDVVKSNQQCSLCRVVLPDGATSVVGVEAGVTVQRLVDRLLQRRNLMCGTYDVLLKGGNNQGDSPVIDASSPSTVLGGLEVVVERRCLMRIEIAGRCVTVRCRPQRKLRHVLRPVLARYASQPAPGAPSPHRALLRDNRVINPDTPMQELDGARIQIIELPKEGEGFIGSERDRCREDDADSWSDIALRLQEEEPTSTSRNSIDTYSHQYSNMTANPGRALESSPVQGSRVSDTNPVTESRTRKELATNWLIFNIPKKTPSDSSSISSMTSGSSSVPSASVVTAGSNVGRVRAALRPGPPLHHHPPDFLENLRETQRQRLQHQKSEPSSPRTPPPLPPKPSARSAPTVV